MEKSNNEVRFSDGLECRNDDGVMSISGYAAVFDSPSKIIGGVFVETIEKRAFEGVDLSNTFLLYNHNLNDVLGNTKSETLSLRVDETGLQFRATLPETQLGKDTFELIKRGDVSGVSFGFLVKSDTWNTKVSPEERTIKQFKEVREISITPFPAYEDTRVSARALDFLNECRECRADMKTNKFANEANQIIKEVKDNG